MNLNFLSLILLLGRLTIVRTETEDVYNTAEISSDLDWKSPTNDNRWSEQSGGTKLKDGSVKIVRTLEVCNTEDEGRDGEHWLRSPYIDARSANRLSLEVVYSIGICPGCRETFTLYYYHAYSDEATSTFPPWREGGLYNKIDTLAAHKLLEQNGGGDDVTEQKTYSIDLEGRRGIYVAFQTHGVTCMSILKVRLYYHYCPQITRNLAHFARTVVGAKPASLVAVDGTCTANAVTHDPELRYYCNADGVWQVQTGRCRCSEGFEQNEGMCKACPANKFKSMIGNGTCKKCPDNSVAPSTGTRVCQCVTSFYRSKSDNDDAPCTKTPSAPLGLSYKLTRNSARIRWKAPAEEGGRSDLYYSVSCETCDDRYGKCQPCPDSLHLYPNVDKLFDRDLRLSDVDPLLFYQIKIYSHNGVSEVSKEAAEFAQIRFSTSEIVPSAVQEVRANEVARRSLSLYWRVPERHNGAILEYEVQLQPLVNTDNLSPLTYNIQSNTSKIVGLEAGTSYQVRMRARTSVGVGLYSDPVVITTLEDGAGTAGGSAALPYAIAAVALIIAVVAVVIYLRRRSKLKRMKRNRLQSKLMELDSTSDATGSSSARSKTYVDYRDPHMMVKKIAKEIEAGKIRKHSVIGQGEFGEVWRGTYTETKTRQQDVAIKSLKNGVSIVDQTNFLREACTMAQFHDPNIVQLKGVVTKHMPAMIVTEYMENGSLDKYLQKRKGELSVIDLLKMQRGVASGMKYLANMKYVHRDLAARNILIDSKHCCKVSDFGLSRTLENDPNATYTTQGGKIALRWTAPECIRYRKFTSASDVWSYGIVMWEIMSYGEKPYWDMNNDDVTDVIEDGYRLPCPGDCPCALHEMMLKCWSYDPRKRPDFNDIYTQLNGFVSKPNLLKNTVENSCLSPSDSTIYDASQPLLNPDSPTSIQDVSTLEEWLDMVRLGKYRRSFYAHGINDLEALSNISTNDLERLGISTPEHRNRLQSGIDTLRRHFNHTQRFPTDHAPVPTAAKTSLNHHQPVVLASSSAAAVINEQQMPPNAHPMTPLSTSSSAPHHQQQHDQQHRPGSFRQHRCETSVAIV